MKYISSSMISFLIVAFNITMVSILFEISMFQIGILILSCILSCMTGINIGMGYVLKEVNLTIDELNKSKLNSSEKE